MDAVGLEPALVTLGAKGERLNGVWPSSDGAADYGSDGRGFKSLHPGKTSFGMVYGSPAARRRPGKRGSYVTIQQCSCACGGVWSPRRPVKAEIFAGSNPVRCAGFGGGSSWSSRSQVAIHGAESEAKRVHEPTFSGRQVEGGPCPAIHQGVQGPVAQFA